MSIKIKRSITFVFLCGLLILPYGSVLLRFVKLAYVVFGFLSIVSSKTIKINTYIKWAFVIVCLSFLSIIWAKSKQQAVTGSSTLGINFLCLLSLLQLVSEDRNWRSYVYPCLCIFPIIRFFLLIFEYGFKIFGGLRTLSYAGYNSVGLVAALGVVLSIFCYRNEDKIIQHRQKYLIFLTLNLIVVVLSMSRKAIIYLAIPLLFYYIFNKKDIVHRIKNVLIISICVLIAYFLVMHIDVLYNFIGRGLETLIDYFNNNGLDESASGRITRIDIGLNWFRDRPWLGYGTMNYFFMFSQIDNSGYYVADNNFIEILVSFGIIGFILYYFIYILLTLKFFKYEKSSEKTMWYGILLAQLICDYGASSYIYLHIQYYLFMAIFILYDSNQKYHKNNKT